MFYHMYGRTIGELEVNVIELCDPDMYLRKPRLWHVEGAKGDVWLHADIPITHVTSRLVNSTDIYFYCIIQAKANQN